LVVTAKDIATFAPVANAASVAAAFSTDSNAQMYSVEVMPTGNYLYCVSVPAGAANTLVRGAAGPANVDGSNEICVAYDADNVVTTASAPESVSTKQIQVSFSFSDGLGDVAVFSPEPEDNMSYLTVEGGAATFMQRSWDTSMWTYWLDVAAANNQQLSISLNGAVATDTTGRGNLPSNTVVVSVAFDVDCKFKVVHGVWGECVNGEVVREITFDVITEGANNGRACPRPTTETKECGVSNCLTNVGVDCDCLSETILGNCCNTVCRPSICGTEIACFDPTPFTLAPPGAFQEDYLECHCDQTCHFHNDCCFNFEDRCEDEAPKTLLATVDGVNCAASCASETEFPTTDGGVCTCSENCEANGNCCDDFYQSCHHLVLRCGTTVSVDSSIVGENVCGTKFTGGVFGLVYPETCDCDSECRDRGELGTCCDDHEYACRTCRHRCGESHPGFECQCDDNCAAADNCCPDYDGWCTNCLGWSDAKSQFNWEVFPQSVCALPQDAFTQFGTNEVQVTKDECQRACFYDWDCTAYMVAGLEDISEYFCYLIGQKCTDVVVNEAYTTYKSVPEGTDPDYSRCGDRMPEGVNPASYRGKCACDQECFQRDDCCPTIAQDCDHVAWVTGR